MQDLFNFIKNNYSLIIEVVLLIASILILIFKKNLKLSDSKYREILLKIPGLIVEAESMMPEGHGADKLKYVLNQVLTTLEKTYGSWVFSDKHLICLTTQFIENILETPTKKGD